MLITVFFIFVNNHNIKDSFTLGPDNWGLLVMLSCVFANLIPEKFADK